jgi:hypothetical protein
MANCRDILRFKCVGIRARWLLIGALFGPVVTWGATWSSCQTITSVSDYTAYSNSFYLNLSPGIPGCSADTAGGALYRIGMANVTADSYKSLVASTMVAFITSRQVMIYYDSSQPPACFASIVSLGGYANQCN